MRWLAAALAPVAIAPDPGGMTRLLARRNYPGDRLIWRARNRRWWSQGLRRP